MTTLFLEVAELSTGRIVLRRGEDQEVLVTLEFSPEVCGFLQGRQVEVAKVMLNAGLQMAGQLINDDLAEQEEPYILH